MKEIKNVLQKTEQLIDQVLAEKTGGLALFLSFTGIIIIRVFEEKFLAYAPAAMSEIITEFLHNFLFFAITFTLVWFVLSLILKKNPAKLATVVLWASMIIFFPPLIDMAKTGGEIFWSFYLLNSVSGLWSQFITIFGNLPSGIVYFGSKIVLLSAIAIATGFIYLKTRSLWKAFLNAFLTYLIFFLMGAFPSLVAFAYYPFLGKNIQDVTAINVAQLFGSPKPMFGLEANTLKYAFAYHLNIVFYLFLLGLLGLLFFAISRKKFVAVLKNSRYPQTLYHFGLFFVGAGLGWLAYPQNLSLNLFSVLLVPVILASIWLAWEASVVVNDLYDYRIDEVTNSDRPLQKDVFEQKEYAEFGAILFVLSIFGGMVVSMTFAAALLAYQIIAWFYSATPYRLKRFPVVASLVSAIASLIIVFMGFILFSGADNLKLIPWRVVTLLLVSLTLSIPIKDFKDIAGDKKDGVWTIPVLFGEELGRIIVGSGIFISFIISPFFMNEFKLFWWALLFGGGAFLAVTHKKIKPRQLFWWVQGFVAVYAAVLIEILFVK